jgi:HEAT repeat protein
MALMRGRQSRLTNLHRPDETIRAAMPGIGQNWRSTRRCRASASLGTQGWRKKRVREAAGALGKIDPHAADAISALIECLNDGELVFRCRSAQALGEIGPAARDAIPGLMRLLTNAPPHDDRYAFQALKKIDPDLADKFIKQVGERRRRLPGGDRR